MRVILPSNASKLREMVKYESEMVFDRSAFVAMREARQHSAIFNDRMAKLELYLLGGLMLYWTYILDVYWMYILVIMTMII